MVSTTSCYSRLFFLPLLLCDSSRVFAIQRLEVFCSVVEPIEHNKIKYYYRQLFSFDNHTLNFAILLSLSNHDLFIHLSDSLFTKWHLPGFKLPNKHLSINYCNILIQPPDQFLLSDTQNSTMPMCNYIPCQVPHISPQLYLLLYRIK